MIKAQMIERTHEKHISVAILMAILVTGCTSVNRADTPKGWAPHRSLATAISSYHSVKKPARGSAVEPSAEEPIGSLSLRVALTHALLKNPELAAFSWEVRATDAKILQAGLLPNPELGIDVENFGGSATQRGFIGAESTYALSQLIELGGKREKRSSVARLERDLAGWDYEAKRLDVYVATAKAFMDTLGAQQRRSLKRDQLALARQVRDTVRERVKAGRASALEDTKADVLLANARIEADHAMRGLQASRDKLASFWGSTAPAFKSVDGNFDDFPILPTLEELLEHVSDNPDVARLRAEMQLRRSTFDLEKARNIPDLTLSAGVRRFEETGDSAFVTGISIPIPVFGLNPSGVLEAERRISKARHLRRGALVQVTSSLKQTHRKAAALYAALASISTQVLPGARRAFEAAQQGYQQGKFDFLDVLDAERTLFEAHERYLETAAGYHRATLDIERLTGRSIAPETSRTNIRGPEKKR